MHQIASLLPEYGCYFSQFFSNSPVINFCLKLGLLDRTILSGKFKDNADEYLRVHHLKNDYLGRQFQYDLVVLCSDLLVPSSVRGAKTIWVQEGMTDKLTAWSKIVKKLGLPSYLSGNTSLNGSSNFCDIYCTASEGYKEYFQRLGTDHSKLVVTGMPNFDNAESFLKNDFPHKGYVLVATSDIRETYGIDDRIKFIKDAVKIANGRKLIFKLHPNENPPRAIDEIIRHTQRNALIFTDGDINHMIANCDELVTQYSSVVYIGLALNKKVHSYFDIENLRKLMPIQNEGMSAHNIAKICRSYIEFKGTSMEFLPQLQSLAISEIGSVHKIAS